MEYCIGIDLGGTNIAGGIADQNGKLLHTDSVKTGLPCSAEAIADRVAMLCRRMAQDAGLALEDAAWVGVGAPGSVDTQTGTVLYANNLEFYNTPLGALLNDRLQRPVFVDNDANAAAWGEYCVGAGRGSESLVMVTLGTGVGGGVILNGRPLTGCNGAAGEIGHMVIELNGRPCTCGMNGCFEAYASATALIASAREAMQQDPASKLWAMAGGSTANVTGRLVFEAANAGDAAAKAVVEQYIHYLCVGVTGLINIFQPEVLCIGGGISRQGDRLIAPLRAYHAKYGYARDQAVQTRIVTAELFGDAGIIGAALLGHAVQKS